MKRGTAPDMTADGRGGTGWFYGWAILCVTILGTICTSPGQTYFVGLFNESLRAATGVQLDRLALAYGIATFIASLPLSVIGKVTDRVGVRATTVCASLGLAAACVLLTTVSGFFGLMLAFFLLRLMGQGTLGLVSSHALAMWFERRLSFVEGLRHGSMSIGIAVLPPAVIGSIAVLGWRETYWVFAGVLTAFAILAGIVLRNRPEDIGQHVDNDTYEHAPGQARPIRPDDPAFTLRTAVRTRAFWILSITAMVSGLIGTAFLFHTSAILEDAGAGTSKVGLVISAWGVALGVVQFGFGSLVDRIAPKWTMLVSMLLMGLSSTGFLLAGFSDWMGVVAMLVFGVSMGLMVLVIGPTTARYFGRTHHGAIRGLQTTVNVIGTSLGPFVFAATETVTGSFSGALWASLGSGFVLALVCLSLEQPVRAKTSSETSHRG